MNKIYDQKGGTCIAFACANILERKTSKTPKEKSIYSFYEKYSDGKGVTVRRLLNGWKADGFCDVKISDYELVWSSIGDKHRLTTFSLMRKLRSGYFLAVIKTNNGLRLDPSCYLLPSEKSTGKHMVAVHEVVDAIGNKCISFENSWGEDFGDKGIFYVKPLDIYKAFLEIWEVKF